MQNFARQRQQADSRGRINLWCVAFRNSRRSTKRPSSRTPTVQVKYSKEEGVRMLTGGTEWKFSVLTDPVLEGCAPAGFSFLPGWKRINQGQSRNRKWIWTPLLCDDELEVVVHSARFSFPLEYNQSFTLSINRNHRGFRRVVSSRGLKLGLLHKG